MKFLGLLCGLNERSHKMKALLKIECICLLVAHTALPMSQSHHQMPVDVYSNFKVLKKVERCDAFSLKRHIVALHLIQ